MTHSILRSLFTTLLLSACNAQGTDPGAQSIVVGNAGEVVETTAAALQAFATGERHRGWTHEPAIHGRTANSPHGRVQIYFNDLYLTARRTETYPMPVGAMVVKELFTQSDAITGYSIGVKVTAGTAAETWLWWEAFGPSYDAAYFGLAVPVCEGCHGDALDRDRSLIEVIP